MNKALKQLEGQIMKDERSSNYAHFNAMLSKGLCKDEIVEQLTVHRAMAHHKWEEGKVTINQKLCVSKLLRFLVACTTEERISQKL